MRLNVHLICVRRKTHQRNEWIESFKLSHIAILVLLVVVVDDDVVVAFLQIHHIKCSTINWLQCASFMRFNEHKRTILKMASTPHRTHCMFLLFKWAFAELQVECLSCFETRFFAECLRPSASLPVTFAWCIDMQLFLLLLLLLFSSTITLC